MFLSKFRVNRHNLWVGVDGDRSGFYLLNRLFQPKGDSGLFLTGLVVSSESTNRVNPFTTFSRNATNSSWKVGGGL